MNKLVTYEEKKKYFPQLFDLDQIKKECKKYKNCKTFLKKTKKKGLGVFANKNIKKGEIICYYLVKIHDKQNFNNIFDNVYTISIVNIENERMDNLIGDIFEQSLLFPSLDGIAYWGYLVNEPSGKQTKNSICVPCEENFIFKNKLEPGNLYRYNILAITDIKKGDEIMWHYGERYNRTHY